ncbi:MAG: flagellar hook protein FlgE, partial [Sulfurimonas sp.]
DGGNTYKYTRAGDFKFDAGGNFIDNNGFIAQGWLRDSVTGKVDSAAPIENINIPPGLTTPANATEEVVLKANLNSGPLVESFSPAYTVASGTSGTTPAVDDNGFPIASGDVGVMFNEVGEAFSLQDGQGVWASFEAATTGAQTVGGFGTSGTITLQLDDGSSQVISYDGTSATTTEQQAAAIAAAVNGYTTTTGVKATVSGSDVTLTNDNSSSTASHNIRITGVTGADNPFAVANYETAYQYTYNSANADSTVGIDKTFNTIASLREALENEAQATSAGAEVMVNEQGKLELTNQGGASDINLKITAISGGGVTENTRFTRNMEAMNTVLQAGTAGKAFSQSFNAATHSSSIDVFDSLGSKHTLRMEFRKTALDTATGSTWDVSITVPEPATIDTVAPTFEKKGSIRFNNDGSLATYSPPNISFTANNGSSPDQQINLSFGTANKFDGMTSFDSKSATSGISQDGYAGGDLVGIRIDQSGTLIGSFSNGRSFGLAQIAMAKFTNNEGLSTEGGNVFIQTAISGDPIIGTAATAGRGFIQSAALEASNVDLSRALTQLIIVQRGFQANGKTITTSDQLLQTLIGLKN